jgi:hypothetical protein
MQMGSYFHYDVNSTVINNMVSRITETYYVFFKSFYIFHENGFLKYPPPLPEWDLIPR